jgi:hypothetical protein
MDAVEPVVNVFIDNAQRLRDLTFDLPRNGIYPKPSSRGLQELNRDAHLTLVQLDLTIKQGIASGILGPTNLSHVVMMLLNDAGLLMSWLHAMRNRGEITPGTWRRARRLHRALWASVGNPPHNEF